MDDDEVIDETCLSQEELTEALAKDEHEATLEMDIVKLQRIVYGS